MDNSDVSGSPVELVATNALVLTNEFHLPDYGVIGKIKCHLIMSG